MNVTEAVQTRFSPLNSLEEMFAAYIEIGVSPIENMERRAVGQYDIYTRAWNGIRSFPRCVFG